MFKGALNLICLVFYVIFHILVLVTNAESESKEHVHIKLHMPSVVRKQSHYHHQQKSKRHHHPQLQYDSYQNYAPAAISSSHHLLPAQTLPKQLAFTDGNNDDDIEDYSSWYSSSEHEVGGVGDQIIPTHLTQDFVMFPKPTSTHETQIITQQFSTGVDEDDNNENVDDNNKSNEIIVSVGKELTFGNGGDSSGSIIPSNSAAVAAAMRSNKKQQQLLQQILHQQPEIINVASAPMPKGNKYRTHQIYDDSSEDTSDDLLTTHVGGVVGGLEMSSLGVGDSDALTVDDISSQLLYKGGHAYKFAQPLLHSSRLRKRSKYKNPIKSQRLRTTQILTGAYPSLTRLKLRNQNYDKHLHQQHQHQQQQQLQQQKDFNLPSTSLGQDSYVGTGHALRAAGHNLHDHNTALDLSDESENLSSEETINSKSNAFNYRDLYGTHTTPIAQSLPLKSPFRSSSLTSATLTPSTYHPSFTSYTSGTKPSSYQWLQQQHYGHLPKTSINTIPLSSATVTSIASHKPIAAAAAAEVSNFSVNSQTTSRHKKSKNRFKNKRNRLVIR